MSLSRVDREVVTERISNTRAVLRVAVVAADAITASALSALLAEEDGLEPVAQLSPSKASAAATYGADVALWDFGWSVDADTFQDSAVELPDRVSSALHVC